jgi:hypothetical protein
MDIADYHAKMAEKIDDHSEQQWVTLEQLDQRLSS